MAGLTPGGRAAGTIAQGAGRQRQRPEADCPVDPEDRKAAAAAGRPDKMWSDLVARKVMPATEYLKIKKWLTPNAGDAAEAAAAVKPRDLGRPRTRKAVST